MDGNALTMNRQENVYYCSHLICILLNVLGILGTVIEK